MRWKKKINIKGPSRISGPRPGVSKENFKHGFEDKFMDAVIDRTRQNQELFAKLMDDDKMAELVKEMLLDRVLREINSR